MRRLIPSLGTTTLLLITLCALPSDAAPPAKNDYQDISHKFFDVLASKGGSEAIEYLFGTNSYLQKMPDSLDQMKAEFTKLESLLGDYVDYELLIERSVTSRFVYQYYFVAYERQPIKIEMQYYRPSERWVMQNLKYSDSIDDDIVGLVRQGLLGK